MQASLPAHIPVTRDKLADLLKAAINTYKDLSIESLVLYMNENHREDMLKFTRSDNSNIPTEKIFGIPVIFHSKGVTYIAPSFDKV